MSHFQHELGWSSTLKFFVLPSLGQQVERTTTHIGKLRGMGIIICKEFRPIDPEHQVIVLSFQSIPVAMCVVKGSSLENIAAKGLYRARPYGTECFNSDGEILRELFSICLPERVPARIAKLMGIDQKREPTVAITFEAIERKGEYWVLVVPRGKKFDPKKFVQDCAEVELFIVSSDINASQLISNMESWFSNVNRPMFVFRVEGQEIDWRLTYAKLYFVASGVDIEECRLDSVHLLGDFTPYKPNFRPYWTSNK